MTLKHILLFSFSLLAMKTASATVKDVSVESATASNVIIDNGTGENAVKTYTIVGGYSGSSIGECAGSLSSTSTCDACTALAPCGGVYQCASRSIHPNLLLTIRLTLEGDLPANPTALVMWGSSTPAQITLSTSNWSIASGALTVQIPWKDICSKEDFNTGGDCIPTTPGGFKDDLTVGVAEGSATTFATGFSQKFTLKFRYV
ncbi:MAG: hypothetical protein ACAH59_06965, partial [Pseudobdellovibrionaceae bacterium]